MYSASLQFGPWFKALAKKAEMDREESKGEEKFSKNKGKLESWLLFDVERALHYDPATANYQQSPAAWKDCHTNVHTNVAEEMIYFWREVYSRTEAVSQLDNRGHGAATYP